MNRWIRGGIVAVAALTLVLQPGQTFAGGVSVREQAVQVETEGQEGAKEQEVTKARSEPEASRDGWEEEYTDTDNRLGMLSVRCEAFQGFHGTIELQIRNKAGGWEKSVALDEGGAYAVNLPLPVGDYKIDGIKAETDGREFSCQSDRMDMVVEEGKIAMCRITITPDSVYRLSYEEIAVGDTQDTAVIKAMPATRSDGSEQRTDGMQEDSDKGTGQETGHRERNNLNPLWSLGILGAGLCLYGFYYVIKRRNEMGG